MAEPTEKEKEEIYHTEAHKSLTNLIKLLVKKRIISEKEAFEMKTNK